MMNDPAAINVSPGSILLTRIIRRTRCRCGRISGCRNRRIDASAHQSYAPERPASDFAGAEP